MFLLYPLDEMTVEYADGTRLIHKIIVDDYYKRSVGSCKPADGQICQVNYDDVDTQTTAFRQGLRPSMVMGSCNGYPSCMIISRVAT